MRNSKNISQSFKIIFLIFLSISCQKLDNVENSDEYGLFTKNIVVDGTTRRYAIYIPKDLANSPHPLIFELHGGGVYIEDMTGEGGLKTPYKLWMNKADSEKFIVIFPEGLNGIYGKPTWNDCRGNATVSSTANDISFISKLLDEVSASYNINANRIYASGTSNGGLMALRLAVELSDKIAAVAATVSAMADS
ncbi:LpqC, partial [hydrothermal vent metagenome]